MDFTCVIESTSSATSKLAKMTLDMLKAGYTIQTLERRETASGMVSFHLTVSSIGEKNRDEFKQDLSQLKGYQLVSVNDDVIHSPTGPVIDARQESLLANQIEALLLSIKDNYPNFSALLKQFSSKLNDHQRNLILIDIGKRVGAGIYLRDYSLGSPLPLQSAMKRELLPALKQFSEAVLTGNDISIRNCLFCANSQQEAPSCQFISGFIQGFLNKNIALKTIKVAESFCGSGTDGICTFSVQ